MKADKAVIMKAAELGILLSMEDFLFHPLKPGRLKTRFEFVRMIVNEELAKMRKNNPNIFTDNKEEINICLTILHDALPWVKGETHIGSVISFCLSFLEKSPTIYDPKLYKYLNEMLDYYERNDNINCRDIYIGTEFDNHWQKIKELYGETNG